jgi:uncharacterized membrane protein YheB (UPF0754 family)
MSTNNPFAKHTSSLFGSRGCDIDQALTYAHEVMSALSVEQDKTAMMTAIMVVVNTAANAWTQSQGPSPEQEIAAAWVRDLVAQEIDKHAQGLQDKVHETVSEWLDENLDDKVDEWVQNSLTFEDQCDHRVERWIENNLDISDKIEEAINDMDLVVRVR